jgi:hypothetical protein
MDFSVAGCLALATWAPSLQLLQRSFYDGIILVSLLVLQSYFPTLLIDLYSGFSLSVLLSTSTIFTVCCSDCIEICKVQI